MKAYKKKYIHVYMDVTEEMIYFHSTSTASPLGKCLLDFIYTDLDKVLKNPEHLLEILF